MEPQWLDPAKRAQNVLDKTLRDGVDTEPVILDAKLRETIEEKVAATATASEAEAVSVAPVGDVRNEEKVLIDAEQHDVRMLFFTQDESVRVEGSPAWKRLTDLRQVFAEVHVVVVGMKTQEEVPLVSRYFDTVWIYTTQSTTSWRMGLDAYTLVEKQLVFSNGFRADVVIAEDTYVSGVPAARIAQKYDRPLQLHIHDDFFDDAYLETLSHPTLFTWATHYVVGKAASVRTRTTAQRDAIVALNPALEAQTELLPSYYHLSDWRDFVPVMNLHERYPRFKFIVLHISSMRSMSHSEQVLLAVSPLLRKYPTVGLVVVGNGPFRSRLEKQAIALGLQHQIEFEPMPSEIISHLKSANTLVHLSEDSFEDDIIYSAASVKIPMVLSTAGVGASLFEHGASAQLCDPLDVACVTDGINHYLNYNHERTQMALRAQEIVFARIEQDYSGYLVTYGDSIKRGIPPKNT